MYYRAMCVFFSLWLFLKNMNGMCLYSFLLPQFCNMIWTNFIKISIWIFMGISCRVIFNIMMIEMMMRHESLYMSYINILFSNNSLYSMHNIWYNDTLYIINVHHTSLLFNFSILCLCMYMYWYIYIYLLRFSTF